ncbi:MAG: radical SAM protein [Acidobacteria bacterium]|jgi:radical SAM protein with 4Fe4S-binding SPASM domain|nr:radical SAM protein [Acidobacteriota bacterium]
MPPSQETAVPEITFADFRQRAQIDARRIPIEGTIETTFRCNLNCVHCYVNEPAGASEVQSRELSLERLKVLVDEIVEEGCLYILLTGGEVLVRPDFPELYLYARSRGLLVVVFTNGTLVTDRLADLFVEHTPEAIEITLYGMTKGTYERVTRVPGSYERCLAGIRRLVGRKLPLTLKTMALTWNQDEVAAMEEYARGLGLDFRFDSSLNPRVDCGANRNGELQIAPERALQLDLGSPERLADLRAFCERLTRPDLVFDTEHVYTCGAGQSSFTVDPYGRLQMCQLSRRSFHDLKEGTFAEGWHELFPRLRDRTWQTNDVCRRCSLMALCVSCPGAAEMETGDPEAIIPGFCELTHLKAWAVMGESSGHRRDATCCLGEGRLASRPEDEIEARLTGGCGSCGHADPEPPERLVRLERRRPDRR